MVDRLKVSATYRSKIVKYGVKILTAPFFLSDYQNLWTEDSSSLKNCMHDL